MLQLFVCCCGLFAQDQEIIEHMRVVHYVVEVRALDAQSRPILGLKPEDFLLTNRGTPIVVNTARWVDETAPQEPEPAQPEEEKGRASAKAPTPIPERIKSSVGFVDMSLEPIQRDLPASSPSKPPPSEPVFEPPFEGRKVPGRLLVLFVQNDIGSNRNQGLVHMIHHGKKMIDQLHPSDWLAVFSFDSHLKMHLDFTQDHEAAKVALNRCLTKVPGRIIFGGDPPSIADFINIDRAEDTASVEDGLTLLATALGNLPGEKLIAFLGWGFGNLDHTGVKTDRRFDKTLNAMYAADVTVFSLDITMAEYHSLETTLKRMAQQTGGLYERTANHPELSVQRFIASIQGYYVISYSLPEQGRFPELDLKIKGHRKARVAFSRDFKAHVRRR